MVARFQLGNAQYVPVSLTSVLSGRRYLENLKKLSRVNHGQTSSNYVDWDIMAMWSVVYRAEELQLIPRFIGYNVAALTPYLRVGGPVIISEDHNTMMEALYVQDVVCCDKPTSFFGVISAPMRWSFFTFDCGVSQAYSMVSYHFPSD